MELWPLLIPACIVCVAAASVVRRERGGLRPGDDEASAEVALLTLAELRVPDGVVVDLTARDRTVAPPGSLGARLRSTAERTAPAAPPTHPIRIRRRRRQPLVATRRSA